ncbi:MAG: sulfatase-like hydrolase/transferase [Opitutales bacterium]|nr:sulfatase-like hydrolase/transferase [Opitutales bacterium]
MIAPRSLRFCVVFASLILAFLCHAKTNVLLILSDDQAWSDYGFMGHPDIQTPNIDKLADESLVFTRGYVVAPICRPSLASIASGLYMHQHGITANDVVPFYQIRENAQQVRAEQNQPIYDSFNKRPTLIKELVNDGYLALQTGKWWEGSWKDAGFTHGMTHADPERGGRHGDVGLKIGRQGIGEIESFLDEAQSEEKPFFIWYAPYLPHFPHNPPERLEKKYQRAGRHEAVAKYYAMCEWFDETCGEVLKALEERNLREDTLIVYVCDNGWTQLPVYDDPVPANWRQPFAPKSKGSPYENGIRTPIMLSLPGKIDQGVSLKLASSIDLFPTIMSVCGIDTPAGLPGIDLTNEHARNSREAVFGSAYSSHNMEFGNHLKTLQYRYLITDRWKFISRSHGLDIAEKHIALHDWDVAPQQLYAIRQDEWERTDLTYRYPEIAAELQGMLDEWLPVKK